MQKVAKKSRLHEIFLKSFAALSRSFDHVLAKGQNSKASTHKQYKKVYSKHLYAYDWQNFFVLAFKAAKIYKKKFHEAGPREGLARVCGAM